MTAIYRQIGSFGLCFAAGRWAEDGEAAGAKIRPDKNAPGSRMRRKGRRLTMSAFAGCGSSRINRVNGAAAEAGRMLRRWMLVQSSQQPDGNLGPHCSSDV